MHSLKAVSSCFSVSAAVKRGQHGCTVACYSMGSRLRYGTCIRTGLYTLGCHIPWGNPAPPCHSTEEGTKQESPNGTIRDSSARAPARAGCRCVQGCTPSTQCSRCLVAQVDIESKACKQIVIFKFQAHMFRRFRHGFHPVNCTAWPRVAGRVIVEAIIIAAVISLSYGNPR